MSAVARFFGGAPAPEHDVRVIGREPATAGAGTSDGAPGSEKAAVAAMRADKPVEVAAAEPTAGSIERRPVAAAKVASPATLEANRIAELREHYESVVSLIEKVDKHLDTQDERSRRLVEVMEKFPAEALAKLEGLSEHQTRMNESLTTMHETMRTSLENVTDSFGSLALSNERLGEVMAAMKQRDEARDRRLQEHMEHTVKHNQAMQKWMVGMLVLGSLGVAAALVVAVFVVVGPGASTSAGV